MPVICSASTCQYPVINLVNSLSVPCQYIICRYPASIMSISKYPIISSTWLSVPCKYTLSPVPYQDTFITLSVSCQYSVSTLQLLCQCPVSNLVSTVPLPGLCRYPASIKYSAIASTSQYPASTLEISCQLSISTLSVLCQYPASTMPVPCQCSISNVPEL